ncbi:MAG TPA: branched-chain amino acid ABC transporter permease [Acidimicrobiales bacterium]|nr:branched-chain amino acid ABC transporter permease [Acidimicrobiales bacterium]
MSTFFFAVSDLRRAHPVLTRATLTVLFTSIALVITYFLDSVTNFNLATGAAYAVVILGLSFLTGASGQVSLGNGAFMGIGAYAVAIWSVHHATTPIVATLALATAVGAGVGLLIGLPATRLRGPYLAGMTIAFALAFEPLVSVFGTWTNGDAPIQTPLLSPPGWLASLVGQPTSSLTTTNMWLADISIVVTGIAFFFMANLFRSRTGRAMRLVRENEVAAELAGVSLPRARVVAFMVSAAYAGLGGGLFTLVQGSAQSSTFNLALSITLLSLLVIGGIGTLSGALIGGLVIAYSQNWINWLEAQTGVSSTSGLGGNLKGIIFGLALILVMLLAPLGIAGTIRFVILQQFKKHPISRPSQTADPQ